MNLYDYWFHQNFFSLKEIKKINKTILENKDPNQIDFPAEHITKINEVTICKYFYLKNIFCKFRNYIEFINNTYFGYNIFNEQDNDNIHLYISKLNEELNLLRQNDLKHIELEMGGLKIEMARIVTVVKERLPKSSNGFHK